MPSPAGDESEVEAFLRRRARGRRVLLFTLAVLLTTVVLGNAWQQYRGGDDWARFDRRFFVVQAVMSGDRLAVESADGTVTQVVRLLGIDAPALADADRSTPAAHGALDAYRAAREAAQSRRVMLSLPPLAARATDGAVLAYVHPDAVSGPGGDGPADDRLVGTVPTLNEQLAAAGWAYADRRSPHPMHKQFEQAEAEARKKKRGLWADVRDDQQPAWRRAWLAGLKRESATESPGGRD
ncbi:MAG: Thermonuclease [Phycisphaerales bacterium]|nr:Thermonuclease [Phycisphaerales bacterium]